MAFRSLVIVRRRGQILRVSADLKRVPIATGARPAWAAGRTTEAAAPPEGKTWQSMLHLTMHTRWKRLTALLAVGVLLGTSSAQAGAPPRPPDGYRVARAYVERFFPRWFSYEQTRLLGGGNALLGPDRVTPLYRSTRLSRVPRPVRP
ncbi:hypothetical protein [Streptomyces sp. bgisy034]|uniref:hypothetical protein n=1 Tax=Streptomyces sp. bgisy034 TaxID=3413774 RepID=UPI003EBB56A6